ncbi:hypothetical protein BRC86_11155 [Halobacteriales archaeon QS_3_64_16]|nr:MAG: hypothetical protein BRC86_11155 [Halobacteriales archaeon QS_3_64_16]
MAYRSICNEHLEQQTAEYLRREGHEAVHVEGIPSLSADDTDIGVYARENGRAVLTDDDFLDEARFTKSRFSIIRKTSGGLTNWLR